MKKYFILSFVFLSFGLFGQEINWLTLEQAEVEMKKSPNKLLFIDFYTDWCGWCKKMDTSTFKEPEVIKYINEHYIPVKFDAESKEEVKFRGKTYKFLKPQNGGYRGVNSFAYFSLRGKLSYPAYAVMTNKGKLDRLLLGYMSKEQLFQGLEQTK
ncbi:MAG: DUF255 domain-containing protein [Weeksellaceae bacterium]|nr:DUF255 domain-containing protein [Weeksellaceae bacterium]